MLRYRLIILQMFATFVLCTKTIQFSSLMKDALILNKKMPCIYTEKDFEIQDQNIRSMCSMEHIFPRSFLNKKDHNDMHNIIKTINELNNKRSNYKYTDEKMQDNNWKLLSFNNYVNHKNKLFIPNNVSRGFISRSILYMVKEYDYNIHKVIDKETLIKWYYQYPPCTKEKYHNEVVKEIQNTNNIFISCYNKKSKTINNFIQTL